MNREIIFRGKRVDNGKWVYGSLVIIGGIYYIFIKTQPSRIKKQSLNLFKAVVEVVEVIPKTVGQYTGLCGKNGTKIFEGDIVVWDNGDGRIVKPFEVAFDSNYGYMFCARKNYHDNSMSDILDINFIDIDKKSIEVIGNIYDNKKLIEEQDK